MDHRYRSTHGDAESEQESDCRTLPIDTDSVVLIEHVFFLVVYPSLPNIT